MDNSICLAISLAGLKVQCLNTSSFHKLTLAPPCSHSRIFLIFFLLLGQKPVVFIAQWQEGSPGTSLVFLRRHEVVGVGIQLLIGAALGVQLTVQLLAAYLLRVSVKDPAVFQHGMDVANRHRQAGKDYEHDNHSEGPAWVLESHFRGLKRGRNRAYETEKHGQVQY